MISIIIPVKNQLEFTKLILQDIKEKIISEYEVIIINDNSTDWTDEWIRNNFKGIYISSDEDIWVNKAWNIWVENSSGEYILIINNDIVFTEWIDIKLIDWFDEWISIVCPTSTIWPDKWKLPLVKKRDNICGWCYMMRREDWKPIDSRLDIWYWDDWIYITNNKKVKYICWIIHHYESRTLNSPEIKQQIQKRIDNDKLNWKIILDEIK